MNSGPVDSPPSQEHHGSPAATDDGNDAGTNVRRAEVRMIRIVGTSIPVCDVETFP